MRVVAWLVALGFGAVTIVSAAGTGTRQATNIGAQELAPALHALARERGVQFVYRSELVADRWTSGVNGNLTFEEAMAQLLNETGLTYRYLADRAITIVPAAAGSAPSATKVATSAEGPGGQKGSSP